MSKVADISERRKAVEQELADMGQSLGSLLVPAVVRGEGRRIRTAHRRTGGALG